MANDRVPNEVGKAIVALQEQLGGQKRAQMTDIVNNLVAKTKSGYKLDLSNPYLQDTASS